MEKLLTGANGFLGKVIFKELGNNHKIKSLSRTSGDYQVLLENEIPNFKQKFDVVIHSAGKAHSIPRTVEEKKEFHDVNVLGTLNLLQGLEKVGIPEQFVFISSVSVYGQESGVNINEDHPLEAKDPYGLSKIEAEEILKKWCKQHNVIYTILRLPLLVGENPPGNLGAMLKAINKGYYFNIGGGKTRKSMVLAKDVAIFLPVVSSVGGIYNLTDGFHPNFYELSTAISLTKNKKMLFNLPLLLAKIIGYFGDLVGEKALVNSLKIKKITSALTFDDSKARELLGWNPEPVLDFLKKNAI
ncbi:NAD-dependent epimerase/dehydratase family protein [Flavobacterium gawalongense]|uniref:NAD-dependent epimerase/dehydratase family protein n=1 Tax=Flavobacterium gawalongense TaxID=2594432 RepID=A0A553BYY1_9FLAO|nr:NAD-dependent epimerase/dehydratase family protein [Flavobacterium gawalongense]TRX13398.1 NAD-dependent epimerase/dehydratase family protein [Flavobacterium gawalongense]TRX15672.1 NAD-dependent epimerase/dehydratase family protein [Flavobacterium gawalongense]TRX31510.1 NAD-dependent epimerase/dehydratase family protein [Flavobacterium gawalongense]